MLNGVIRSAPNRTKLVIRRAFVTRRVASPFDKGSSDLLGIRARQYDTAGMDLTIAVLFWHSIFFHDLGRDQHGPNRTACSHCRGRTRLFGVSEFFGKKIV